jgi:DNA-binding IscR family transcriptional regulator
LEHSVFNRLDDALKKILREITLEHLVNEAESNKPEDGLMFYI